MFQNGFKSVVYFFQTFVIFLIIPTAVNYLITNSDLALNLYLPIYMALFVDIQGNQPTVSPTFIRNLVFFILLFSIL